MKYKIFLTFILVFLISGFLPLQSQESFTMGKDITVEEDEVQNIIIAFGGDVLVKGKVLESVIAFGGTITISGEVGDLVLGFGACITLKSSAVVKGDVAALGGTLKKEYGSTVKGDTIYFETPEDITKFLPLGLTGTLIPFLLFKLISVFIWFFLALLVTAFFPHQISFASSQIRKSFWPVFGTGLLSIIVFTGLMIFAALLCLILIGIPILFCLIILGFIIKVFGRVVLFFFFGESLMNAFGKSKSSPILIVILGLILVSIITFIPIVGFLFSFCLSIIGWGVVLRTKFGTTENIFKRTS
ncbi:MAG: hypothetical protein GQ536_00520 [Candidatus Aminicenantes bacterium]|nr:hypothetical protein [Candidatus Aminicenantes bacterium]